MYYRVQMFPFGLVHLYPRVHMYIHMYPRYEENGVKPVLQARVLPPPLPHPHSALQLANRLPVKLGPLPSPRPPSPPPSALRPQAYVIPPPLATPPTPSISAPVCPSNSAPKGMSYPLPYVYHYHCSNSTCFQYTITIVATVSVYSTPIPL